MKIRKKQNKYFFVLMMLLAISLAGGIFTMAYVKLEERTKSKDDFLVVTSFYPIYVATENVIGDNQEVILENLSEPQTGCLHDYQLTPQDMILLSKADVFIVNGGGIEGFLSQVAEAYPELKIIQAADGLELLGEEQEEEHEAEVHAEEGHVHEHGEENAHAWMDTRLYSQMVQNIADALSEADTAHQTEYQENAHSYCEKIQKLTVQIEDLAEELSGRNVVIFHEAYEYVAHQYGMNVTYCLNLDEERQVSAGEVAEVMEEINNNHVSVILAEELYGKDMGTTVEKEGNCKVYYLDALTRGGYDADSYLSAMQKNIDLMREVAGKE